MQIRALNSAFPYGNLGMFWTPIFSSNLISAGISWAKQEAVRCKFLPVLYRVIHAYSQGIKMWQTHVLQTKAPGLLFYWFVTQKSPAHTTSREKNWSGRSQGKRKSQKSFEMVFFFMDMVSTNFAHMLGAFLICRGQLLEWTAIRSDGRPYKFGQKANNFDKGSGKTSRISLWTLLITRCVRSREWLVPWSSCLRTQPLREKKPTVKYLPTSWQQW